MKILFDHQIFNNQVYGGISRYFYSLMNEFYKKNDVRFNLSSIYSHNEYLKKFNYFNPLSFLKNKKFKGRDRLLSAFLNINKANSFLNLKLKNFDIFHPTEYDPYFLNYIGDKPFVLTVYDMIHEIYNKNDFNYISKKKKLIKLASKVIAISENSKKDILKFIDIPEANIEVTYLASSLSAYDKEKVVLPGNFLLFVGNRGGYKNFKFFLDSIVSLLIDHNDLYLVCVGGSLFTDEEKDFIKNNNLSKKIIHLYLNDNQLSYVYSKALAFVFPSLYEGFGIPILEAFSSGCPVLLSNRSSFPEIALDAAIYFNPEDSGSIKESILRIILDKRLRAEKIAEGLLRAKDFSWEKTSEQTKQVYKSIL